MIIYLTNLFLSIYLFGVLTYGISSIKYIGIIGSMIFFLIEILTNWNQIKLNYKKRFTQHKRLLISFLLIIISIIFSIIFSYSDSYPSLKEFKSEFLNMFLFLIIFLGSYQKRFSNVFIYTIWISFIYNIIFYGIEYIKYSHLNFSIPLKRNFSDYFEILFPFGLSIILITKSKTIKISILLLLIIGLIELILTGARGAWVSVLLETILFIFLIAKIYQYKISTTKVIFITVLLISSAYFTITFFSNHSYIVARAIKRGISPNGRDKIIETRLPIFIKHQNILTGIGGPGNFQYNKFLIDHKAPKILCEKRKGKIIFHSDEPFVLQIFYKEGIIGVLSFLIFILIFILNLYKYISNDLNNIRTKIIYIAILTSFIGTYIIRGIVENRTFKYIVFYIIIFIITNEIQKRKNENSIYISGKITK